jgi:prolyl-tRNA editing enzyme YbaK/EbsC (Cys-tRNA(Pro) deacylase)
MEIGGVTPICLPEDLPLWIDQRVMAARYIILGGGDRSSKIKVSPRVFDRVPSVAIIEGLASSTAAEAPGTPG